MTRKEAAFLLPLCAMLAYWQYRYFGYVKDDTFISLRYAANLAQGHGLVFNHGQFLEGYTNFLWIILATPAFWLGIDPLTWIKVFGILAGQGGIFVIYALARAFNGHRPTPYGWLAAGLWATAPTVILWSTSGMEGAGAAVFCGGGVLFALKVFERAQDDDASVRHAIIASVLMLLGAMTRPEGHAVIGIVGVFAGLDLLRRGTLSKPWLVSLGVILGTLVVYHGWRMSYFGDPLPNTFYAKASMGAEGYRRGLDFVTDLVTFLAHAGLFPLALVGAFARKKNLFSRSLATVLVVFFLAYLVKVGRDEMKWFRMYLPVLPLAYALAATGLGHVVRGIQNAVEELAAPHISDPLGNQALSIGALVLVGGGLTLGGGYLNTEFVARKADWHNTFLTQSQDSFMDMARYVRERSQAGDVISFQDLGAAPYVASDLRWVDTIGILDKNVSSALRKYQVNPFLRGVKNATPQGRQDLRNLDRTIRDYIFDQDPNWMAFIAYVRDGRAFEEEVEQGAYHKPTLDRVFRRRIRHTSHAHGLSEDRRFEDYTFEKYWRRNRNYWVVLYRAKDHMSGQPNAAN